MAEDEDVVRVPALEREPLETLFARAAADPSRLPDPADYGAAMALLEGRVAALEEKAARAPRAKRDAASE